MGSEFIIRKRDGVRVYRERKSDGVRNHHQKENGVRVHHEKEEWGES